MSASALSRHRFVLHNRKSCQYPNDPHVIGWDVSERDKQRKECSRTPNPAAWWGCCFVCLYFVFCCCFCMFVFCFFVLFVCSFLVVSPSLGEQSLSFWLAMALKMTPRQENGKARQHEKVNGSRINEPRGNDPLEEMQVCVKPRALTARFR